MAGHGVDGGLPEDPHGDPAGGADDGHLQGQVGLGGGIDQHAPLGLLGGVEQGVDLPGLLLDDAAVEGRPQNRAADLLLEVPLGVAPTSVTMTRRPWRTYSLFRVSSSRMVWDMARRRAK